MNKASIADYKYLEGTKVILREDFNVPINKNGVISDDKKIIEALPTINFLIERGAKVIIISHLGRPEGKVDPKFSLEPVVERLKELLDMPILFEKELFSEHMQKMLRTMKNGDVMVLENIRFFPEEEKNDEEFAKKLADLGDIYCDDAFGTSHRAHASIAGITKFIPSYCGLLMAKEVEVFSQLIENPQRPFVAILGGAKVSDKIKLISNLIDKVDCILIGGAMSYTFLVAEGYNVGNSKVDEAKIEYAKLLLEKAKNKKVKICLPIDHLVAKEFSFLADYDVCTSEHFPEDGIGMDIGPKTIRMFSKLISQAKTAYWNGPMGVFEYKRFSKGTRAVAKAMAENKNQMIVGGGDSASAVRNFGFENDFYFVSTGGGASLAMLEGSELPGLVNLKDKE